MVSMFKALESSGLRGFLGCSAAIYEKDLVTFFGNAIVRGDTVISLVQGMFVEISEEYFAGVFDLPTEGLTSVTNLPTNRISELRRVLSDSGDLIKTSCKKKEMKMEYRLLNDMLAKAITAKAVLNLILGESKALPPLKILSVKSVGTYIAKNKSVSTAAEKVTEDPVVAKVVTAAAKRRPAPAAETVAKKKRTTIGRDAPTVKDLSIVPIQEAIPISMMLIQRGTQLLSSLYSAVGYLLQKREYSAVGYLLQKRVYSAVGYLLQKRVYSPVGYILQKRVSAVGYLLQKLVYLAFEYLLQYYICLLLGVARSSPGARLGDWVVTEAVNIKYSSGTFLKRKKGRRRILISELP
ncbi:hypothetical protein F511_28283 [Dorcoceras hygrometricum]|uniref:Uncharacterized protein n=1 Tax=Dorcoceras hygrometricum TaxID=472368 RepID=A0A2Z7DIJ7_9LAMI|nr:hypothetical protein F511_28283 [Dorcoceras hygrometricum]